MIGKLNISARQIGRIVDVINDIADQTNMLALMRPLRLQEPAKQEKALRL